MVCSGEELEVRVVEPHCLVSNLPVTSSVTVAGLGFFVCEMDDVSSHHMRLSELE